METSAPFTLDVQVRFADLDAYGHVNNAVFFTFLETARTRLFMERFSNSLNAGLLFVVAKAECEYHRPISLSDRVAVSLEVSRIGRSSFDLDYRIHDGEENTFATARTTMVCFDGNRNKPVAIPPDFRSTLGSS